MGPYQIRFYSKIFGNKHCRYNEGPLYKTAIPIYNCILIKLSWITTFGHMQTIQMQYFASGQSLHCLCDGISVQHIVYFLK